MTCAIEIYSDTKIRHIFLIQKTYACPSCGVICKRHSFGHRWLREIGLSGTVVLEVTYSKFYCKTCEKYFTQDLTHLAPKNSSFTNRVRGTVINLVVKQKLKLLEVRAHMLKKYHVNIPYSTIHDWIANMPIVGSLYK